MARKTNSKGKSTGKTTRKVTVTSGKSVSLSAPELAIGRIEEIYSQDRHAEALAMLLPLERQYPFSDPMLSGRFDRLLAFVYTHLKKFSEAEQIIRRGQELHPGALDFLFASCFIKLSLREFAKALEEGKKFLQLAAALDPRSCSPLDSTVDQLASVLNYVGTAMLELGNREGAKKAFEEAIAKDRGNYLPYLNLIGLFAHERNWDQVNALVDQGLKQCRNITELRMLAEAYQKRATVSACIMVKNEEEMLPGCLDSLRDWVDEIVIVDTGSTDRTIEIAHQYGAKVFHHPWQNSFSESRNHTLEHATSDWVFIIDADERLYVEDIPQVYQILNQTEYPIVAVNVFNFYPDIEDTVTFLPSKRFFRASLGLRYSGIVHNQLKVPEGTPTLKTAIRIKHYGYGLSKERMTAKLARTRALLEKQLSESPDDAFALFNYAQLHRASPDGFKPENAEKVLKAAGRAIQITSPDNPDNRHLYYMCLDQLAWTHYYLKQYDQAEECCLKALKTKADYLDPLLLLGYVYYAQNKLDRSREYFEKYLVAQEKYDPAAETENIILLNLGGRADALFNLAVLAEMNNEQRKARDYYAETLRINPNYHSANLALARYYLRANEPEKAKSYFLSQIKVGKHLLECHCSVAAIAVQTGEYAEALLHYQAALEIDPGHTVALIEAAHTLAKLDRSTEAVRLLNQAVQAGNKEEPVLALLADNYARIGSLQQAVETFTLLVERNPNSSAYLNDLANCHYRLGAFDKAEALYRQALRGASSIIETHRNLGLALARQHKEAEAISELNLYLKECPGDPDVQHVLGDLYLSANAPQAALGHFEQYLRLNPQDSRAFFRLAECYLLMGHKESAILGYQKSLQLDPQFQAAQERLERLLVSSTSA